MHFRSAASITRFLIPSLLHSNKMSRTIVSFTYISEVIIGIFHSLSSDEVPILNKMPHWVNHWISSMLHTNIMPGHSCLNRSINWRDCILYSCAWSISTKPLICVVSSIPIIVDIAQMMIRSIPSPITNIKSAHKSHFLVDYHTFFMMTPQLRNYWMSFDTDVATKRL